MAVFDGLVASGTRAGVRLAIDVAKGEREPFSASGRYRETIAELDADRLAHVYVSVPPLLGFLPGLGVGGGSTFPAPPRTWSSSTASSRERGSRATGS